MAKQYFNDLKKRFKEKRGVMKKKNIYNHF